MYTVGRLGWAGLGWGRGEGSRLRTEEIDEAARGCHNEGGAVRERSFLRPVVSRWVHILSWL